jgi:ketosteroid isomerase-like protein
MAFAACGNSPAEMPSPQDVVNELLAADRAASAASANTTVVPALTAMFTEDVVMPAPGVGLAIGHSAVEQALRGNPDNATAVLEWHPVRGGVSADGHQGFTYGYMTMRMADGVVRPLKYLSYWVKRDGRWQVAAYKRGLRPAGDTPTTLSPPSLPAEIVTLPSDPARLAEFERSLSDAEKAFSDESQMIGLGPAFAKYGAEDAMNMGGPNDPMFVIGAEAISQTVSAGLPPAGNPYNWSAERVIVASSGDLGVSIGYIRLNAPPDAGAPPRQPIPFFTIWRRANLTAPWRYIAE